MGQQVAQGSLFYGFRLDDHVPADHILRRIDGPLDFGFVREPLPLTSIVRRLKPNSGRCRLPMSGPSQSTYQKLGGPQSQHSPRRPSAGRGP